MTAGTAHHGSRLATKFWSWVWCIIGNCFTTVRHLSGCTYLVLGLVLPQVKFWCVVIHPTTNLERSVVTVRGAACDVSPNYIAVNTRICSYSQLLSTVEKSASSTAHIAAPKHLTRQTQGTIC